MTQIITRCKTIGLKYTAFSHEKLQACRLLSGTPVNYAKRTRKKTAALVLDDGTRLPGYSFGKEVSSTGEVVFNTGLVGYPEALTDPSYRGQILTLTYPLIGNYGVPDTKLRDEYGLLKYCESSKIQTSGLLVQNYTDKWSHWNSIKSLSEWLIEDNIPALYGIDTRLLTKLVREKGTVLGKIEFEGQPVEFSDPNQRNLIAEVSRLEKKIYGKGNPSKIIVVDCGVKENMIRNLLRRGAEVHVVPWNYDFTSEHYDGLFISNGPGDPHKAPEAIQNLKKVIEQENVKPIFGICMGNQLLAAAAGATSYKMPLGNRYKCFSWCYLL